MGGFLGCPIVQKYTKNIPTIYKNIPNIYPNIFKYIQDIPRYTKTYKIPSGGGAARPARPRGALGRTGACASGPGRAGNDKKGQAFESAEENFDDMMVDEGVTTNMR